MTLNVDNKIFVVDVMALAEPTTIPTYPSCQAQVASSTSKETGIPTEYFDFSNVFSSDSAEKLPEHNGINDYPINLLDNKQLPYGPIYNLGLVGLELWKIYIEANLVSGFIKFSKSLSGAPILFIQKKAGILRLCVDY